MTNAESDELKAMVEQWRQIAKRKFLDAKHEENEMGRRLIEHGATCYFNAAEKLADFLKRHAS